MEETQRGFAPSMRDALSTLLVVLPFSCSIGLLFCPDFTGPEVGQKEPHRRAYLADVPEGFAREPKCRPQLVGRFHHGSRESLSRTTFYPCRSKSEHHILHTPDGDSETAGEECPISSDGELQELTRGEHGHLQPTSVHVFLRLLFDPFLSTLLPATRLPSPPLLTERPRAPHQISHISKALSVISWLPPRCLSGASVSRPGRTVC